MATSNLTAERARELLDYDPDTGVLTWRTDRRGGAYAGDVAGSLKPTVQGQRYLTVMIDGRRYLAHRIAWLIQTGSFPEHQIDHVNMDGTDNRWSNLRKATGSQNQANRRAPRSNTTGYKGVVRSGQRFCAQVYANGKRYHLGTFDTLEEAHQAYKEGVTKHHGKFARVN